MEEALEFQREKEQEVVPNSAVDYIYSWRHIKHLVSCGRPLFYSYVEAQMTEDGWERQWESTSISEWTPKATAAFANLVRMIIEKVNGGNNLEKILPSMLRGKFDNTLMYALLAASVGLYSFPDVMDKSDMVRLRMAWIVSSNVETNDLEIAYPSEGIFNMVLSMLLEMNLEKLITDVTFEEIMSFFAKPGYQKQFEYCQVASVLTRLVFLLAHHRSPPKARGKDDASIREVLEDASMVERIPTLSNLRQLLYPRLAKDVLGKFVIEHEDKVKLGINSKIDDKSEIASFFAALGEEYYGALTTFGYFYEMRSAHNPLEFIQSMLYRGAARYFAADMENPGADVILPLILPGGNCGVILIQVVGVKNNILASGHWPKDHEESKLRELEEEGIEKDRIPTDFVWECMEDCTIAGAFHYGQQNANRVKTGRGIIASE